MICSHCRKESESLSRVCPFCGRYMGEEAAPAFDPGEAVPVYQDEGLRGPRRQPPGRPAKQKRRKRRRRAKRSGPENYSRRMVNWAKLGLGLLILLLVGLMGSYVYLMVTPNGQLILARMGRDASADAYWSLGLEQLDQGYVSRSITTYEKALALEPEHPELVDKLMLLGEAYEAAGLPRNAEEVYTRIYEELEPAQPLGYRNVIRLMLQENRQNEAVELMKKAEEQTGDTSFGAQRASMVPLPPTATMSSGRHLRSVTVEFVSPQGYEIYYTSGSGPLPDSGTLYTTPFTLGEGTHEFRAVCVSSALMSDEMTVKYVVTLPQPPAPYANLAPASYSGRRSVKLRDMETDLTDPRKQSRIYYTIDGTAPSIDSPRYVDEAIRLPGGRVTLRAIAVNGYGKVSNELQVQYTINNVGFRKYFNGEDEFRNLPLMKTNYEEFVRQFGEPQRTEDIQDDAVAGTTTRALYQWGEARFCMMDIGNILYEINTSASSFTGPRGSKVGEEMESVTERFRDMGQLPNDRGDRGIYYDIQAGYANYRVTGDDPTTGVLRYVATLFDQTSFTRILTYQIKAGRVESINLRYVDRKLSNVQ